MDFVILESGKKPTFVMGAEIKKGFLVRTIGKAFFNARLLNGTDKKSVANKTIEESIKEFPELLWQIGFNKCGRELITRKQFYEREDNERQKGFSNGEIEINFHTGFFGLRCTTRLPKKIWEIISSVANYHSGSDEDMELVEDGHGAFGLSVGDVRGWYYEKKAIDLLTSKGYKVSFGGHEIKSFSEIVAVQKMINELDKVAEQKRQERIKKVRKLESDFDAALSNDYSPEEKECEEIRHLPKVLFLGAAGHDIYGGGTYYHITNKYFYKVRNNGSDGGTWAWNNYPTGGAGAICTRYDMTEKLKKVISEIEIFEEKSAKK
jgi:hypothetical protein